MPSIAPETIMMEMKLQGYLDDSDIGLSRVTNKSDTYLAVYRDPRLSDSHLQCFTSIS